MNDKGMTLIEVLMVTVVAVILVVAAGAQFNNWMEKYRVETQVKTIYSDLMDMRMNAMKTNAMHFIHLDTSAGKDRSYSIYRDDGDGKPEPGTTINDDTEIKELSKTGLDYRIRINGGTNPWNIRVDRKGLINVPRTIWIVDENGEPYIVGSTGAKGVDNADIQVDIDCIVVSRTRINMGKLDTDEPSEGGTCVQR